MVLLLAIPAFAIVISLVVQALGDPEPLMDAGRAVYATIKRKV